MNTPTLEQSLAFATQISQYADDPIYGHSRNEAMICVLAAEVVRLQAENLGLRRLRKA